MLWFSLHCNVQQQRFKVYHTDLAFVNLVIAHFFWKTFPGSQFKPCKVVLLSWSWWLLTWMSLLLDSAVFASGAWLVTCACKITGFWMNCLICLVQNLCNHLVTMSNRVLDNGRSNFETVSFNLTLANYLWIKLTILQMHATVSVINC